MNTVAQAERNPIMPVVGLGFTFLRSLLGIRIPPVHGSLWEYKTLNLTIVIVLYTKNGLRKSLSPFLVNYSQTLPSPSRS